MAPPKAGFVTCVHPYYDLPAVTAHRDRAIEGLKQAGCDILTAPVPRSSSDALEIAARLRAEGAEAVVLFFCTWVAEDITLALARETMDLPMLLWSLPYLDPDIPMPSPMSGLTSSGSNIRRLGKSFASLIGAVTPEKTAEAAAALRVAAVARRLRQARFGIAGSPCPGMLDVAVDETELQKALGVTTVHLDLDQLVRLAEAAPLEAAQAAARRLADQAGAIEGMDEATLVENLRLYVAMKRLSEEQKLSAYCVRCWPELRDQRRLTMCATHALMAMDGLASTCEVDLPALVTTYVLSQLAAAPAFNFDLTGYFEPHDALQLAHCGAAHPALAGDRSVVRIRRHMRTGTGATVEFPFPEGSGTIAKLLRPANGELRLAAERCQVLPTSGVRGSVATVRPESGGARFLDFLLREAVEHHLALVYGDLMRELALFCDFTGVKLMTAGDRRAG
jgi:L-arabinose isomerase